MKRMLLVAGLALALGAATEAGAAQDRQPRPAPDARPGRQPGEVVRMFDAYVLMQAQERLELDEAQLATFVPRLKDLQETRRRLQFERQRMLGELGRMVRQRGAEEADVRERLEAMRAHDERAAGELRRAYEGLDEALTILQRARFRLFEEEMERRKFEMLSRARQARRPR